MAFFIVLVCLIVLLLVLCFCIAVYFFKTVCVRKKHYIKIPVGVRNNTDELRRNIKAGIDWFCAQPYRDISILSADGLLLCGKYLSYKGSKKTAICVHSYTSDGLRDFGRVSRILYESGFNVLIYDQRSCGASEGRYITFGIKERYDCLLWIKKAIEVCPDAEIYLLGVSMGATTALLALGLEGLPENVRGVVADCGYISPYQEFRYILRTRYRIPPFPVLWFADMICRVKAGFSLREATTLRAVSGTSVPVFFAHGLKDKFVLPEASEKNYEVCSSVKALFLVDGAGHFNSFSTDTDMYIKKVKEFFSF